MNLCPNCKQHHSLSTASPLIHEYHQFQDLFGQKPKSPSPSVYTITPRISIQSLSKYSKSIRHQTLITKSKPYWTNQSHQKNKMKAHKWFREVIKKKEVTRRQITKEQQSIQDCQSQNKYQDMTQTLPKTPKYGQKSHSKTKIYKQQVDKKQKIQELKSKLKHYQNKILQQQRTNKMNQLRKDKDMTRCNDPLKYCSFNDNRCLGLQVYDEGEVDFQKIYKQDQ